MGWMDGELEGLAGVCYVLWIALYTPIEFLRYVIR